MSARTPDLPLDDPIAAAEFAIDAPARQHVSQRPPAAVAGRSPQELLSPNPRFPEAAGAFCDDGSGSYRPAGDSRVRVVHDGRDRDQAVRDAEYRDAIEREERLAPLIEAADAALAALPGPERERLARRVLAERGVRA